MYLDSHAHLDGKQFASDREATIQRAVDAGVRLMLAIGNGDGPDEMGCAIPFAENYDWIYASAGVHPQDAPRFEPRHAAELERLTHHEKFLAVGEIGLDYYYEAETREVQIDVLRQQLDVASTTKKPVLIHCRPSRNLADAFADFYRILGEAGWPQNGLGGVMHCFSGSPTEMQTALDLGLLISFAGNLTYPSARQIRDAAQQVPLDRFLTETDCPYLAPVPHRGRRNEPAFVSETTRCFAELRGLATEEAGELALRNFRRFFDLL